MRHAVVNNTLYLHFCFRQVGTAVCHAENLRGFAAFFQGKFCLQSAFRRGSFLSDVKQVVRAQHVFRLSGFHHINIVNLIRKQTVKILFPI